MDVDRITPQPVWRKTCGTLYRSDSRVPATVFQQSLYPKDVINGQYDIGSRGDASPGDEQRLRPHRTVTGRLERPQTTGVPRCHLGPDGLVA